MRSNNNNKLKAFVRFDGSGRIVPGSLIVQRIEPKDGNWRQINSKECCLDNECIQPIYESNWLFDGVSIEDGIATLTVLTAPWIAVEMELLNCETSLPMASHIFPKGSLPGLWQVPVEIWDVTCNIRVRGYCGPDFYSDWVYEF